MRRPILAALLCTMLCTILLATTASATTLHVPSQYPLIADAMVFASRGDTVLVAAGTYYEANILMKNGVTLISETGLMSGAMIDAEHTGRIIECVDCDDTTAIIGFTLAGGYLTSGYGAAISCTDSSPRLENLDIITSSVNSATSIGGGGLGCMNSSPTLNNIKFRGCTLQSSTVGGGGAMVVAGASYPTLNDVLFSMNWVTDTWGGALAIASGIGETIELNNVTFIENYASATGGGGALHVGNGIVVIDGAVFQDNWAAFGGAVHLACCRPCTMTNVTFTENTAAYGMGGGMLCEVSPAGALVMTDAVFLDNTAATTGGGMACNTTNTPTITGATFAGNSAVNGGGLSVHDATSVTISGSTFYGNDASNSGGGIFLDASSILNIDASIVAYSTDGGGIVQSGYTPPVISCTDIYGNTGGDWIGFLAPYDGINGNLWVDPLFCDAYSDIFDVAADSPCLPGNNTCGVQIGAYGMGCPPSTDVPDFEHVLAVHHATPNPFTHWTVLAYVLPQDAVVDVRVFDVAGRLVRTLADAELQTAGPKSLTWNGRDDGGRDVASGVYFFRANIGGESMERRAVLLR